jgi:hypothetical protein
LDPHKQTFLDNLNKNVVILNPSNQNKNIFISTPNPSNSFNQNNLNQKFGTERPQGPIFTTKPASQSNYKLDNLSAINNNNKINPNKWDEIDINNKNIYKFKDVELLTRLEDTEITQQKNDFNNNPFGKVDNMFSNKFNNPIENIPMINCDLNSKNNENINGNDKNVDHVTRKNINEILKSNKNLIKGPTAMNLNINLEEGLKNNNLENINNKMNMSNFEGKIITADNFFDKQMDEEESLVCQLDKIYFIENSNLKIIPGKGSYNNQLPTYIEEPESDVSDLNKSKNIKRKELNLAGDNNNKINNNQINNINTENAIIKNLFADENLMKNESYSSISICPDTSVEEYNDYIIKNETDLDLIFDMIYKSQKISLDVMYNTRNKLKVRGYNTVLSLRLKKEKEKTWRFLFDDYKDISLEIEALALLIEYYLEKKVAK